MIIPVRVVLHAQQNEITSTMADGTLRVRLATAPIDGKANLALIKLLSKHFGVTKSKIHITHGHTSRLKTVEILV